MNTFINVLRALYVRFSPTGTLTSTDVQSAIAEVDTRTTTLDSGNVKTTGNQTIAGNKTFSGDLTANSYSSALTANTNVLNLTQNAGARTLTFGSTGLINTSTSTFGTTAWQSLGTVEITAHANIRIPLLLKGATSQTANLLEARNSANAVLASVSPSGDLAIASATTSISATTGSIVTSGGVGIAGALNVGGGATSKSSNIFNNSLDASATLNITANSGNASTSFTANSSAIINFAINGGSGAGTAQASIKAQHESLSDSTATRLVFSTRPASFGALTEQLTIKANGNILIGTTTDNTVDKLQVNGSATIIGVTKHTDTTASISSTTGSGTFAGGVGIGGALNVGGNFSTQAATFNGTTDILSIVRSGAPTYSIGSTSNVFTLRNTTANRTLFQSNVFGASSTPYIYIGGLSTPGYIAGAFTGGIDATGGILQLSAGLGTGSAASNIISFSTSDPITSGSAAQSPIEKMRLAGSGNLLIGTTTDNGVDKLQVNGSATITGVTKHTDTTASISTTTGSFILPGVGMGNGVAFISSTLSVGSTGNGAAAFDVTANVNNRSAGIFRGLAGQTVDLIQARNNGNGIVFGVSMTGNVSAANYTQALSTKTANYTLTASDSFIAANATTAAFAVTLPTAVGIAGRVYTIKKIDSTANGVSINTTSSQTIDGAATLSLSTQYAKVSVISDGANWLILS